MTGKKVLANPWLRADDGTALYFGVWSPDRAPRGIVLLVHGWGEHHGRYGELAAHLNALGFEVWGFDLRGHGLSKGRRGHAGRFSLLTDDVRRVADRAREGSPEGRRLLLLGHSLGGLVALRAVQTGVVSPAALCLSAPWLEGAEPLPAWKQGLARFLNVAWPSLPIPNSLDPELLTHDEAKIRERREDPLIHGWMTARLYEQIRQAQALALEEERGPGVPTLILIPEGDPVVDAEVTLHYAQRMAGEGVRRVLVHESRHEPFNEVDRKARFDEVGRFFVEVLEGT